MSSTIHSATFSPNQWLLEIPDGLHQSARQTPQSGNYAAADWNYYLTEVTHQALLTWFQDVDAAATIREVDPALFAQLNQWIPGSVIDWCGKRCVILPNATLDDSELLIPQEWIDIPEWQGDYFLATQVDWDDRTIKVWGYTTHERIKQQAAYIPSERMYQLDAVHLIQDLNALAIARQLCPDEVTQVAVDPIHPLSASATAQWLEQLSNSPNPRLAVPFATWAALITQPDCLATLAQPRSTVVASFDNLITNLSQWVDGVVEQSWQTLDSLMGRDFAPAYAFRDGEADNDAQTIRRVKLVQLNAETVLLLVLELKPLEDGRVYIKVRLYPPNTARPLPAQVNLSLQTIDQQTVQTISSRAQDDLIQLKGFRCPSGFQFVIQVAQADTTIDLPFVV
ncbi:DUF1822 family protein [filamentous cyanobacterium LEGE 11480]|uniref:DUF1822 family protein n=1 Tax=Romeriopsis navalis LEGE 11480 TaxID=2777977 RepID=A0A928VMV0_9CYAN|nr:DUF1822 family protein [Romeriopsis navalis]MBE9029591.1 DUF1822 family protein [Romeriopsis navalis LEGE 11480]